MRLSNRIVQKKQVQKKEAIQELIKKYFAHDNYATAIAALFGEYGFLKINGYVLRGQQDILRYLIEHPKFSQILITCQVDVLGLDTVAFVHGKATVCFDEMNPKLYSFAMVVISEELLGKKDKGWFLHRVTYQSI